MSDILMPQLGETVTEGTITKWFKSVGDPVAQDEPLFEVSTDKVDSEVPSAAAGTLTEILVPEGETVPVGARLAVVSSGAAPAPASVQVAAPLAPPLQPAAPPPPAPLAPPLQPAAPPPPAPLAPPLQPAAPPPPAPLAPPLQPAAPPPPAPGLLLSPVVRRLIAENGLDPATIAGTGPGGRITRDDVISVIEGRARSRGGDIPALAPLSISGDRSAPTPAPRPLEEPFASLSSAVQRRGDEVVPFSNIRRRTAEHMVRSKATSAHTLAVMEVDFEAIEQVRRAYGTAFKAEEGFSLTYLPFLIVSTVEAIRAWPYINASVGNDALVVHHDIHLGIAVDLESEGLIVPVIHGADSKRLRALAREVRDLATRARIKKLTADDIAGGTFTITNPGPFGTLITAPIINQPQVAILSTDGIKRRPVVVDAPGGGEAIAIHSVGNLALSFDHRVIDGAYASRFLKTMKELIEGRDWVQEL